MHPACEQDNDQGPYLDVVKQAIIPPGPEREVYRWGYVDEAGWSQIESWMDDT